MAQDERARALYARLPPRGGKITHHEGDRELLQRRFTIRADLRVGDWSATLRRGDELSS